mmetsp:Transcript_17628/g.20395  ORF Transcript_17628/g.20395 Transcript_17628/m.20395 type:complete len:87 (+) Transcript_17628:168-428(+)
MMIEAQKIKIEEEKKQSDRNTHRILNKGPFEFSDQYSSDPKAESSRYEYSDSFDITAAKISRRKRHRNPTNTNRIMRKSIEKSIEA